MLAACGQQEAVEAVPSGYPQTAVGKRLQGSLAPKILRVLWDTTFRVTPGLDFYQMKVVTDAWERQDMYLLRTDPSAGLNLRVAISGETTATEWYRQKLTEMAAAMSTPSRPVYAMINADFCVNDPPIHPRGPVHSAGRIWMDAFDFDPALDQQGVSYVGVTFDGRMTIGPSSAYASTRNSLRECTGAGVILVQDAKVRGGYGERRDPRTALGYTFSNIVWMLVVDGRHGTSGMTYDEMASVFSGLGCTDAVNLDGGGSSQMLVRDPRTGEIAMRNWPSDPTDGEGGQERPRLNAWAIVKQ